MVKKLIGFCIIVNAIFVPTFLLGQDSSPSVPSIDNRIPTIEELVKAPLSPEAESFSKYGNTAINLFSGTPDLKVDLPGAIGRSAEVQLLLNYDASGIKVDQIASSVGLGWNFVAGGMVTRQVFGKPDDYIMAHPEYYPFYLQSEKEIVNLVKTKSFFNGASFSLGDASRYYEYVRDLIERNKKESQPDLYNINAAGLSGSFYIDYENNSGVCIDHPDIKIYPEFELIAPLNVKSIKKFKIIDSKGNSYFFEKAEVTFVYDNVSTETLRRYNSSWYLTKIQYFNKRDIIEFIYSDGIEWEQPQVAAQPEVRKEIYESNSPCFDQNVNTPIPLYKITQSELQSIKINGITSIVFLISNGNRKDLGGKKSLLGYTILNPNSEEIKRVEFHQSYFGSLNEQDEFKLRLRLDSLTIYSKVNANKYERYKFEYIGESLPPRNSKSIDFWGYYTGRNINSLIPYDHYFDKNSSFKGSDRRPVLEKAKLGTLSKIIYPTSGSTEFFYKLNKTKNKSFDWEQEYKLVLVNYIGGTDPLDPFDYLDCDDRTNIPPKGREVEFTVDVSYTYNLKFSVSRLNNNFDNGIQFVAIYKVGSHPEDGRCFVTPSGQIRCLQANVSREFCDLLNSTNVLFRNYSSGLASYSNPIYLERGKYKILFLNSSSNKSINLEINGDAKSNYDIAGGLRIYKTIDNSLNGKSSTRYFYYNDISRIPKEKISSNLFEQDTAKTSGVLQQEVNFTSPSYSFVCDQNTTFECQYTTRSSSLPPSSLPQIVTYSVVSEIQFNDSIPNGYIVNKFHNEKENSSRNFTVVKQHKLNGKLIEKIHYDLSLNMLEKTIFKYSEKFLKSTTGFSFFSTRVTNECIGVLQSGQVPNQESVGFYSHTCGTGMSLSECNNPSFNYVKYPNPNYQKSGYSLSQHFIKLDTVKTFKFFNGNSLTQTTNYTYDSIYSFQVKEVSVFESRGNRLTQKYFYPSDFSGVPIYDSLVSLNYISFVTKTEVLRDSINVYSKEVMPKFIAPNLILPSFEKHLYVQNNISKIIKYLSYDSYSNPLCIRVDNDYPVSFTWGYNSTFLTSRIQNAYPTNFFYTSFEEELVPTNSATFVTGRKALISNSYTIPIDKRPIGEDLVMTYWYYKEGWKFQDEVPYSPIITQLGATLLDEIKVYPKKSFITSFNYNLGLGLSSIADQNGLITSFDYGEFNKLKSIRNSQNEILELFEYNLKENNK